MNVWRDDFGAASSLYFSCPWARRELAPHPIRGDLVPYTQAALRKGRTGDPYALGKHTMLGKLEDDFATKY